MANVYNQQGKRSPRPDIVPPLEFKSLIKEVSEENKLNQPLANSQIPKSPSSHSPISWGTPLNPPYVLAKKDIEVGGTAFRPCTHLQHRQNRNLQQRNPITHATVKKQGESHQESIEKKSHQEKALENQATTVDSTKDSPKAINMPGKGVNQKNKSKYWYLDENLKDKKPPEPEPVDTEKMIDNVAKLQTEYTSQPYSGLHELKKTAAEDDLLLKRKSEIMDQVLVDQLSRHVISDAEQDRDPARQNPADPTSHFNTAPLRFKSRRLHDTKVSTTGAITESKLKDRITFGARLISRAGRDALRELFGFYFHTDQSMTVYEYRLFGKNSNKALPLIERGKYSHMIGRRKGKPYGPSDFELSKNLTFKTSNQSHLPDALRKQPIITLRICEANSSSPSRDWGITSTDRDDGGDTALERNDRKITKQVQNYIRSKIKDRSVSAVVGLGKLFRLIDSSGDGVLDKQELAQALETFEISLPKQDFDAMWRVVDENNDGAVDYGEFMRAFIGEMNERRKQIVRKVFKKLDPHKTGKAAFLDLQKLYSARKHPLVVSGQLSQSEVEKQFLDSFADVCSGSEVTYSEFDEYYEGLSIVIESDDNFINMMRNCWGV